MKKIFVKSLFVLAMIGFLSSCTSTKNDNSKQARMQTVETEVANDEDAQQTAGLSAVMPSDADLIEEVEEEVVADALDSEATDADSMETAAVTDDLDNVTDDSETDSSTDWNEDYE